jgi:hypothetical protein
MSGSARGRGTDARGKAVRFPQLYSYQDALTDPSGGGEFGVWDLARLGDDVAAATAGRTGRHQMKMREPPPPPHAPKKVLSHFSGPMAVMDTAVYAYGAPPAGRGAADLPPHPPSFSPPHPRAHARMHVAAGTCFWLMAESATRRPHAAGHPGLLAVAAAINGEDFVPFIETMWYKAPWATSTAWHQDPSGSWDEEWARPGFDVALLGFSLHLSLYDATAINGLWAVPGSQRLGRVDIRALAATGDDSDRLPGAVPILLGPGDVLFHSRGVLHGAFANTVRALRGV